MVNERQGSGIAGDTLNTQLNTTANSTSSAIETLSGPTFIFSLSEAVSTRMINCLQDFFQATQLGLDYRTKLGKVNKEIVIQDQFSITDIQSLPQIVVTGIPVDALPVSLGNKLGTETYGDQIFNIYGGNAVTGVSIEIYDLGKPNVCALADVVFLSLMQYVKDSMQQTIMTVQPQVRFSTPSKVKADLVGGAVYKITLSVNVISEWRQFMEIKTLDVVGNEFNPTSEETHNVK